MEIKDIFGIQPLSECSKEILVTGLKGISNFMELVFKPGLEELGLMFKDEIRYWRLKNIVSIIEKAKNKMHFDGYDLQLKINTRVGLEIIEEGSKIDDEELQEMWASLFVTSCSKDGSDDGNIIFINILKNLSIVEARILNYACEKAEKNIVQDNIIIGGFLKVSIQELIAITGISDLGRIDRELEHMDSISLFPNGSFLGKGRGGIQNTREDCEPYAVITPSALALNLYYKTHNYSRKKPNEFWNINIPM